MVLQPHVHSYGRDMCQEERRGQECSMREAGWPHIHLGDVPAYAECASHMRTHEEHWSYRCSSVPSIWLKFLCLRWWEQRPCARSCVSAPARDLVRDPMRDLVWVHLRETLCECTCARPCVSAPVRDPVWDPMRDPVWVHLWETLCKCTCSKGHIDVGGNTSRNGAT